MELGNIIQGMERDCAKERKKLEDELFTHKCMYSLSYEEFCWALTTNANNILLKRGFMHHFEIDASNQEVIRQLFLYFTGDSACKWNIHAGIIFAGKVGCGKTLLLTAYILLANTMARKQITMYHANELCEFIREQGIKEIDRKPLFIDEPGREPNEVVDFGNVKKPIVDLLAKRYERGARTYATTNFKLQSLEEKYGQYIVSRLREMCNYVLLPGDSRRLINQI